MMLKKKIKLRTRRKLAFKRPAKLSLKQALQRANIPYFGDTTAPILFVLDPVVGNLHAKYPFSKNVFNWLKEHLKNYGDFTSKDILFISSSPPVTGEMWNQQKLINDHQKEHYSNLHKIISVMKPKFIMTSGAKACQQIIGKSVQITKVRGDVLYLDDTPVLPLLSVFYAQKHPELENMFTTDIETSRRIVDAGYVVEEAVATYYKNYRWTKNLSFLQKKINKKEIDTLSIDVETLGLQPYREDNKLLTVQLCWAPGEAVMVPIDYDAGELRHHNSEWFNTPIERIRIVRQLKKILENPHVKCVGQNLKFDWLVLYNKLNIEIANYADDTILMSHLLDENVYTHNINDIVRRYLPEMAGFNDMHERNPVHRGKTRMDLMPPDDLCDYGCGDTDAVLRVSSILKNEIEKDSKLLACYEHVVMSGQRAFCLIEPNGFPISIEALKKFHKKLRIHQRLEKKAILKAIPQSIKDKWKDNGVGLKPNRAAILRDYLYDHEDGLGLEPVLYTKTGLPSISSKQALPYYVADHPIIDRISKYIKNDKLLTTYVAGFYKYIYEGYVRPSYLLFGTVTGRTSSKDPNGQNFPKRGDFVKEYRAIFEAPKGWVFLALDLSQAELRIAAMMSGDETMLQVYREGGDIHTRTAMAIMGIATLDEWNKLDDDTKDLKRFQAKAVNFGFLYGMWWKKFRTYAKTDYGIEFTEKEAQQIRETFFKTYIGLEDWHKAVHYLVQEQGYVRTYDGRIRHLPQVHSTDDAIAKEAGRQAINSPVQSIASDLGVMSLGRLLPYLKRTKKNEWLKVCGFIHDAIVCVVREDKVAEAATIVKKFMETNPLSKWFDWEPEIPIVADAEMGRTLAKMHSIPSDVYENKKLSYSDIMDVMSIFEPKSKTGKRIIKLSKSKKRIKPIKRVRKLRIASKKTISYNRL